MVEKAIAGYLRGGRRLVVPEFGAFLRKEGSGEIVFVEFLKKDDHELTSYLEKHYSITQAEALDAVAGFVAGVKKQIMYSGGCVLEGLGTLKTGPNNMYVLAYDPSAVQGTKTENLAGETEKAPGTKEEAPKVPEAAPVKPDRLVAPIAPAAQGADAAVREQKVQTDSPEDMPVSASARADDSVKGLRYGGKPAKAYQSGKKRTDSVMIIAIIVAVCAIGSLIYGVLNRPQAQNLFDRGAQTEEVMEVVDDAPAAGEK